MPLETIDTFEHDIATEIKQKEATIGDIASASGDIGNVPIAKGNSPMVTFLLIFLILIIASVISYYGYTYYNDKINGTPKTSPVVIPQTNDSSLLKTISGAFPNAIGNYINNVKKLPAGYEIFIISSNSYSSVFAYMIKNESSYADDVAKSLGTPRDTSTTTPPFTFTDVTINNQNMRVGKSASSTIVYAFINTQALVLSTSTEGILSLRSDILH